MHKIRLSHKLAAHHVLVATTDPRYRGVLIFTEPDWEIAEDKILRLDDRDERARQVKRVMIGWATELLVDETGCASMPQELIDKAGIGPEATFTDKNTHFVLA